MGFATVTLRELEITDSKNLFQLVCAQLSETIQDILCIFIWIYEDCIVVPVL